MPFYISVPLSKEGIANMTGKIEKVDARALASKLIYGDAAYLQGLAQAQWSDLDWKLQQVRVRTAKGLPTWKFIVKGEPKVVKQAPSRFRS